MSCLRSILPSCFYSGSCPYVFKEGSLLWTQNQIFCQHFKTASAVIRKESQYVSKDLPNGELGSNVHSGQWWGTTVTVLLILVKDINLDETLKREHFIPAKSCLISQRYLCMTFHCWQSKWLGISIILFIAYQTMIIANMVSKPTNVNHIKNISWMG